MSSVHPLIWLARCVLDRIRGQHVRYLFGEGICRVTCVRGLTTVTGGHVADRRCRASLPTSMNIFSSELKFEGA
jgi:hypothetical protein